MSDLFTPRALLRSLTGEPFLINRTNESRAPQSPLYGEKSDSRTDESVTERVDLAKHIYDMRRARADYFPADLFAEPAWDILLYLYEAGAAHQRTTVTTLCNFAGVPSTTALRWIQRLITVGIVEKDPNPLDQRVSWVRLSPDAQDQMDRFLGRLCGQNDGAGSPRGR